MRLDGITRLVGHSVRVRLTAWNGFVLVVTLLVFAAASYELLAHASIDQVDDTLSLQLRTVQLTVAAHAIADPSPAGIAPIVDDLHRRGYRVAVVRGDTTVLVTRGIRGERAEAELRDLATVDTARPLAVSTELRRRIAARLGRQRPFTVFANRERARVRVAAAQLRGQPVVLAATEPLGDVEELLEMVRDTFVVAIPVVMVLAMLVGYALARRALAPVAAMTTQAEQIGARTLHERLDVSNPRDELGRLAIAFNSALDRVDAALEQQRRFTADASHELRTPVAVIRSQADVALDSNRRSASDYREALTVVRRGSEHLSRIVNDLFLLARADAGQVAVMAAPIYLDDLVIDTVRAVRPLAAAKRVEVSVVAAEETNASGDETLLRRVLLNLLDNAIKYAPEGSRIVVELQSAADGHHVFVTDSGPGVPPESRPFVFDRFYRADAARARRESAYGTGAGLGLSIAREIATLHGGSLNLLAADGGATTFDLVLPLATEPLAEIVIR